ncbi:hypothetical protein [Bacillus sp. BA3]|nr:hypothetical protein [Bacillus sp. BA3]
MRFNEFLESIYVIKEAVLAIASFFCSKTAPFAPQLKRGLLTKGI